MARIAGLFPGQGSQAIGMGAAFEQTSSTARGMFAEADKALGFSLSELCANGPLEKLTLTEYAQPAILAVSCIAFKLSGIELKCAAGHSLGEYSALVAADCLDFADAVALVHKRGRYMQEAVPAGAGKMAAIMGPSVEDLSAALRESGSEGVEIANMNCPGQTVVAGTAKAVEAFCSHMAAKGAKAIPLNVSAPFHCSLMKPAAQKLSADLDAITFRSPRFPVYANFSAAGVLTGEEVRDALKRQVCSSVRWTESVLNMVREQQISHTVEFGSGGVLTKLVKRIAPEVERLEAADPASLEKTKAKLG